MKKGMGDTLGFVATVVGLGALFGALLERTGGARSLADYMLEKMSLERAPWAMVGTGLYLYTIEAREFRQTKKTVLLK